MPWRNAGAALVKRCLLPNQNENGGRVFQVSSSSETHPPGLLSFKRDFKHIRMRGPVRDMGVVSPDMGVMDSRVRLYPVRFFIPHKIGVAGKVTSELQ